MLYFFAYLFADFLAYLVPCCVLCWRLSNGQVSWYHSVSGELLKFCCLFVIMMIIVKKILMKHELMKA